MKTYYLADTPNIWHMGKDGTQCRLDAFEKLLFLYEKIKHNPSFNIETIELTDVHENTLSTISKVHNSDFINAYKTGAPESIAQGSGIIWQPELYNYTVEEAEASLRAVDNSILRSSPTLALTGGGHHCEKNQPFGFCTINTMAISALRAIEKYKLTTALIDLDVHYSNGCFDILQTRKSAFCTSIWSQKLDKWAYFESEGNIWHKKADNINEYESALNDLFSAVEEATPEFIVYHLGTDVLETDRMGGIKGMTPEKLLEREKKVKEFINRLRVPYVMFIGGSYVDHSKGEEYSKQKRTELTNLAEKALSIHL